MQILYKKNSILSLVLVISLTSLNGCAFFQDEQEPMNPEITQDTTKEIKVVPSVSLPLHENASVASVQELYVGEYGLKCTNPEKAIEILDSLLEQENQKPSPDQVIVARILGLRALAKSELGQGEEAFDDLTTALLNFSAPELYALRGLILWRNGSIRGAENDARYALGKQNMPFALMVLGLVLHSQGDTKACATLIDACDAGQCYGLQLVQEKNECK